LAGIRPIGHPAEGFWQQLETFDWSTGTATAMMLMMDPRDDVGFSGGSERVTAYGVQFGQEDIEALCLSAEPETAPSEMVAPVEVSREEWPVESCTVEREEWIDRYLTEERQNDLLKRHNQKLPAVLEIHDAMVKDPTVKAYSRARNIERHPLVQKLFPRSRRKKKKS
jgi:hypothetical protein